MSKYTVADASKKKVSFVVPVYKTEKYLTKCIASILDQSHKNIEVIVVADGPSPEARTIYDTFAKADSRLVRYEEIEHHGAPRARNTGAKYATGDYLVFWDSDCYLEPGSVAVWVQAFIMFDVDFVYAGYQFLDEQKTMVPSQPWNPHLLTCNNYISTCNPMKREIFPGFDEKLESLQDWDMWLTISEKGYRGYFSEGVGFTTEVRSDGISAYGCTPEKWLERYNAVRVKHGIKRDVCLVTVAHEARAQQLAEQLGVDYSYNPSFKPHEYKRVVLLGLYAPTMREALGKFGGTLDKCRRHVHWFGPDIETVQMMPWKGVRALVETYNKTVNVTTCEDARGQDLLKDMGIAATVVALPLPFKPVDRPSEFRVFYEGDQASVTDAQNPMPGLLNIIVAACPDIEFSGDPGGSVSDYACLLSITPTSEFPSEDTFKKFGAQGRFIISNYNAPYLGYITPSRERIVERLRELRRRWRAGESNDAVRKHYINLCTGTKFAEVIHENN